MRLFPPRSRRNTRATCTSLTLPLEGTATTKSQDSASESMHKHPNRKKKAPRFGFGCSKVSSTIMKSTRRHSKQRKGPSENLVRLEEKRQELTTRYEQLQNQLNKILLQPCQGQGGDQQQQQDELQSIRHKLTSCRKQLAQNKEQCKVLRFRYSTHDVDTLHSLSLTSIPPMDSSLKDDEGSNSALLVALEPSTNTAVSGPCQKKVANYTLQECLGKGAHGSVWKAITRRNSSNSSNSSSNSSSNHKSSQHAIKIVPKESLNRFYKIQQLDKEIRALQFLSSHENILRVQNVLHGPAHVYLITELAWTDAHNLAAATSRTQNWRSNVSQIGLGILRALQYMHELGYAHLDIKPENVLLVGSVEHNNDNNNNNNGRVTAAQVRLCDFGYCEHVASSSWMTEGFHEEKKCEDLVADNNDNNDDDDDHQMMSCQDEPLTIVGTLGFMAPEMLSVTVSSSSTRSFSEWNACAADMWSLGATLLDLSAGLSDAWMNSYTDVLDEGVTTDSHSSRVLAENLRICLAEIRRNLPQEEDLLNWICDGLLVTSPQHRFSAATSLCQSFWIELSAMESDGDARGLC